MLGEERGHRVAPWTEGTVEEMVEMRSFDRTIRASTRLVTCNLRRALPLPPSRGPPLVMSVLLETSLGDIVIDLEVDSCPKTCENFLKLCKVYYYNLNAFFNGEHIYCCVMGTKPDAIITS